MRTCAWTVRRPHCQERKRRKHVPPSCPALCRASTSFRAWKARTWMARTLREARFALPGHDAGGHSSLRVVKPSLRALAKQSILAPVRKLDCFVVSLLAMTAPQSAGATSPHLHPSSAKRGEGEDRAAVAQQGNGVTSRLSVTAASRRKTA